MMYVKSIVLDGFKSYGKRTEINGFDPQFNAITGLNGTGKSNILDSICFVLGITQLSNVRVTALQDLVYKSGQSGITKATVSITFDNRDKEHSPIGFNDCDEMIVTRQVVMGGKNKYMINGVTAQNKRVHDLFCSVQLNVNNPHFLIMQGRITKVLNMKPLEILSMIEEAAGTMMYETKKRSTQVMIDKKNAKLLELTGLLAEELTPKINQLKEERKIYLEFQRVEREFEQLTAILMAWKYLQAKRILKESTKDLETKTGQVRILEETIETNLKGIEDIERHVAEHQQRDSANNEQLKSFEVEVHAQEKVLAKANAEKKSAKENLTAEEKKQKQLIESLQDDETQIENKEMEMKRMNDEFGNLKDAEASDMAAFQTAQKKFEAINAGMEIDDDGEAITLQEQLIKARQDATEAATESKQANMHLQHNQTQLKEKQSKLNTSNVDYKKDKVLLDTLDKTVKSLTKSLSNLNYDENKIPEMQNTKRTLMSNCRRIRDSMDRFEARYPQLNFQYQNPEPNFNRRSVKGLVCNLFKINDESTALALETVAGGKLFNVIVDTEITSKKLLQNGKLKQRTTIIPLNKIKGNSISDQTVKYAQKLVGSDNVRSALSLIQFNNDLKPAMDFIFGSVFVCRDMNVAKVIAFDKQILRRCVTLDGDVVDPAGTLSGGAKRPGEPFLAELSVHKQNQAQLSANEQQLTNLETELQNIENVAKKYADLKQKYDLNSHELSVLQQRLQQTSHYKLQEELNNLKTEIATLTETIENCNKKERAAKTKAKEIESKINNSKNNKEQQLKDAESELKRLKKQAENSKKHWQQREQEYEVLKLEITQLQQAIVNGKEQIELNKQKIVELQQRLGEATTIANETEEVTSKLQAEYKEKKSALTLKNKALQKKLQEKENLLAQIEKMRLEIKKHSFEITGLQNQCEDLKAKEAELNKKLKNDDNNQLKDVEQMTEKESNDLVKRIAQVKENRNKLSRQVNTKAQSMLDEEEKEFKSAMKKKGAVELDRNNLLELIVDLDKQKTEFLTKACNQISIDFGSIFGTLLPGGNAKLMPVDSNRILDGVEVKICIGDIWKENLTELSGGQKSLVALSLILAMLLFKPAPIYILDEVDAALDLSHTQNVGEMLRKHFKHSQFIIVSLKDGMFTNANVLFRTQFVDGMSAVSRTINKKK